MTGIVKEFIEALNAFNNKTAPYDVKGEVRRIEGKTAWVRLNGGIDETPVEMTINCVPGDVVRVRVGGGGAWITGNESAPPTDDKVAKKAELAASSAGKVAIEAQETANAINNVINSGALSVAQVVVEYCLSSTRATFTQYGDWSTTLPDYVEGYFYYTRTATYYEDGTVVYSDPVFDMGNQVAAEAKVAAQVAQTAAETADGIADQALALANVKRRVFNSTPSPPYDTGDLWFNGAHGSTYMCTNSKAEGEAYSSTDWTLYSKDVSNYFWHDSAGAHIAENQGDLTTGASQTISSNGTVMMRNGKLVTSWTGSSSSDAALNFYDCSMSSARTADLIASYARSGITQYINNAVAQALTASGLSFYDPNNGNIEAVFGSTGALLYAGGVLGAQVTSDGLEVFESNDSIAMFGSYARIGKSSANTVDVKIYGTTTNNKPPGMWLCHNGRQIGGITAAQVPSSSTTMTTIQMLAGGEVSSDDIVSTVTVGTDLRFGVTRYSGAINYYRAYIDIDPGASGTAEKGTVTIRSDNINLYASGNMSLAGTIDAAITSEEITDFSSTDWDAYSSGSDDTVTIRKFGKVVNLRGALTNTVSVTLDANKVAVFVLPENYRPSQPVVTLSQGSGTNVFCVRITTDGTVYFERYRNSTSYSAIAAGAWFPFNVTWIIE